MVEMSTTYKSMMLEAEIFLECTDTERRCTCTTDFQVCVVHMLQIMKSVTFACLNFENRGPPNEFIVFAIGSKSCNVLFNRTRETILFISKRV